MSSLRDDGWRLIREGRTTPEEVLRMTKDEDVARRRMPSELVADRHRESARYNRHVSFCIHSIEQGRPADHRHADGRVARRRAGADGRAGPAAR